MDLEENNVLENEGSNKTNAQQIYQYFILPSENSNNIKMDTCLFIYDR